MVINVWKSKGSGAVKRPESCEGPVKFTPG